MNKSLLLISFVFLFLTIPIVSAAIVISNNDLTLTSEHDSTISTGFTITNTGTGDMTDIEASYINFFNTSQTLNIGNLALLAPSATHDFSFNINVPKSQAPGDYYSTVTVEGNESGIKTADYDITLTIEEDANIGASDFSAVFNPGEERVITFQITNEGNVDLNNIEITAEEIKDNDNDIIDLIFEDLSSLTLSPGTSETVNIEVSADKNMDVDDYPTTITIEADGTSESAIKNITLTIIVRETFCEIGNVGEYFEIDVREPDSGDDFSPGDMINVEIKITNNDDDDRDVVIVADVYDLDNEEFLEIEEEIEMNIDEDDSEIIDLDLELPTDIDEGDYRVYAKVYEDGDEEEQCREDFVTINVERKTHDIRIDNIDMQEEASCGDSIELTVDLVNVGTKDEDVKVNIVNTQLGISLEKELEINEDDEESVTFNINIPEDASEKDYVFTVRAFFDLRNNAYKDSVSSSETLKIIGDCKAADVSISAQVVKTPQIGGEFSIKVTLFNIGSSDTEYTITASDYSDWATLSRIEPSKVNVAEGDTGFSYIYLTPLEDASGSQSIKIKALFEGTSKEKTVTVDLGAAEEEEEGEGFWSRITGAATGSSTFIIINVVLLVLIIILIIVWIVRLRA